jgi:hypothetical protein
LGKFRRATMLMNSEKVKIGNEPYLVVTDSS